MAAPLDTPALPCPECRWRGRGGGARIGNRRNVCTTCNNFAQAVMRVTRSRLKSQHEDEYASLRLEVELELYRQVYDSWVARHPMSLREPQPVPDNGDHG